MILYLPTYLRPKSVRSDPLIQNRTNSEEVGTDGVNGIYTFAGFPLLRTMSAVARINLALSLILDLRLIPGLGGESDGWGGINSGM